jgi:hypothetical protein
VSPTFRKLALPAAFLVVGLPAGVGVVMAMGGDDPPDPQSAFTVAQGAAPQNVRRAQAVTTLSGSGPAERSFAIDDVIVPMLIAVWDDARRVDRLGGAEAARTPTREPAKTLA